MTTFDAKQLEDVFDAFDESGSGYIDSSELRAVCSDIGVSSEDLDDVFRTLDKNGDGKIGKQAFVAGFLNATELFGPGKPKLKLTSQNSTKGRRESDAGWSDFIKDMSGAINNLPKDR